MANNQEKNSEIEFDVNKRTARTYNINGKLKIVTFAERHSLGHAILSVCAENGIDISTELKEDGTVSKEFTDMIESFAQGINRFNKVNSNGSPQKAMSLLAVHLGSFANDKSAQPVSH